MEKPNEKEQLQSIGNGEVIEKSREFEVNGVRFKMIYVEGGSFMMGAADDDSEALNDEKPRHKVTLDSYYMAETQVTQALWEAVMGSNPSRYKGANRPVECVSWYDCQEFLKKLNALTGMQFRLPPKHNGNMPRVAVNAPRGISTPEETILTALRGGMEIPTMKHTV